MQELIDAGEWLSQAQTNNSRSLRKTYIMTARKLLEKAKKKTDPKDPEAQAGIRRINYLIEEAEQSFPDLTKAHFGLEGLDCPGGVCPIKTCRAIIPPGAVRCPSCGAKVASLLGELNTKITKFGTAILAMGAVFLAWEYFKPKKFRKRRK